MINGIVVPPEPDETLNNATLAGVDSNNNGVRDDIERKIAVNSPKYFSGMFEKAKAYQSLASSNTLSGEEALLIFKVIACSVVPITFDLDQETINTNERYHNSLRIYILTQGAILMPNRLCGVK